MATIYNSDLSKEIQQGGKLQVKDKMPSELAEKVVPVMEVNPKLLRRCNEVRTNANTATGTQTIFSVPSGTTFYLIAIHMGVTKDAACDCTTISVAGTIAGRSTTLMEIVTQTLTAETKTADLSFPVPIPIDGGTNITQSGTKTVGTFTKDCILYGYLVYNDRA